MQWSFPQWISHNPHTDAHLRIMHAHLAFCLNWCKINRLLCIYNGAIIVLTNFWYIGLLEKKVNRYVRLSKSSLIAGGPILMAIAYERLSPFCRGHRRLFCNSHPSRWAVVIGRYYGCCCFRAIICNRKPNTYERAGLNRNACRMLISNEIR